MKQVILVGTMMLLIPLGGCASFIGSVTDRTIMSDRLNKQVDRNKLKSMSGDRRLVRVRQVKPGMDQKDAGQWVICAEPFAGGIASRSTSSAVKIVERAEGSDGTTQAIMKIDERAAAVRLYEDAAHNWCMLRADGMIDDIAYAKEMRDLQILAFKALSPAKAEKEPDPAPPKK